MSTEKTNARNRHTAPIGLVFIVLCVIGLYTVFTWCFDLTRNLADNTAQKTRFEQMLLPVVMFDPPDFTDPASCDNEFLLQSSLWACMLGDRRGSYQFDEYDRMVIPATDVESQAVVLFGPDVKLEHKTIGDMENAYSMTAGSPRTCAHYRHDRLCDPPRGEDYHEAGWLPAHHRVCAAYNGFEHQL